MYVFIICFGPSNAIFLEEVGEFFWIGGVGSVSWNAVLLRWDDRAAWIERENLKDIEGHANGKEEEDVGDDAERSFYLQGLCDKVREVDMLGVADGTSQSICSVVWFGKMIHVKNHLDHFLHL